MTSIQGAKKGAGGGRQPVESPDSLRSTAIAKVLLLVSQGEVQGPPNGNLLKSVYLNDTPIQNSDGTMNFDNVRAEWRPGTQHQEHIAGFPAVESEQAVGVELRSGSPVVRTITGADLSAIRYRIGVPQLQKANTQNGDITGYRIEYAVDIATDGGAFTTVLSDAFDGKSTNGYERSRRVELPPGSSWQIRFRRLTPNQNSSTIADTMTVQSLTTIIDGKFRYPNRALLYLEFEASQFQSLPTIGVRWQGILVQVPSNYDPVSRTYSGIWDGTFKRACSNNPAWVFYDIATNDRYGLGAEVTAAMISRYALYQIAQYCDQMVSDGHGGLEPRFLLDQQIQTRAAALQLLQDIASCYRGVSYYGQGQIVAAADMPVDPVKLYTAANVKDGKFTYLGTARKARRNFALVSWNDPDDFGRPKAEPVVHREGLRRHGLQDTSMSAFGCTRRSQAQRVGNHVLISENLEDETVNFEVGLEGADVQPFDVVQVADPNRAGRRNGGRLRAATALSATLDAVPPALAVGDTIRVMLPNGRNEARTVTGVDGAVVAVNAPWSTVPSPQAIWIVANSDLAPQTVRIIGIEPSDSDEISFKITALKHVPQKYAAIDDGTRLELPPISVVPPSVQPPPASVALSSRSVIEQGIATHVLTIEWAPAEKAVAYEIEWRRDSLEWVKAGRTGATSIEVRGIYAGQYLARVRALNALGTLSIAGTSVLTAITGKITPPPALTSLTAAGGIFSINLAWGFPQDSDDTQRTEIYYSATNNRGAAVKLGDFAFPQARHTMMGLAAGVTFYFWGRLVDRSGNIGPWYPAAANAGIQGQSSADAAPILAYLAGKIGKTELAQDLLGPIQSITPDMAGQATIFAGDAVRYAGVWSLVYAQQQGDMAIAKRVDTVQAQVNTTSATVQQVAQATVDLNGRISATYTLRAQVASNGLLYAAGMGLGVEQQPDGTYQTQVLFQADRFALINVTNNALSTPFVIENGQTFINSAFIANGTITNAKIGDVIQSNNYVAGQQGWRIDKNGNIEINGAAGGGRLLITQSRIEVYRPNGALCVRMGFW
ncbi:host specificity protein J [Lysobacter enzymogenes]|uniref:host specificity protein J n=1 Tax=Lysobacter enzymogenes TaxID=69 RepID=UPI0031BA6F13|nr:host specificity protein J [Lysobacter enzymogenes]